MKVGFAPLTRQTRVYVAGHQGLVGSALWRRFTNLGFENLIGRTSSELDQRFCVATAEFINDTRPEVVVSAAARVAGIMANVQPTYRNALRQPANPAQSARHLGCGRGTSGF
jgi:GDP-L-fucose synthase